MARLFIAVWPPDDVTAELALLHRKDSRGVRFVPPENWHITLHFLGDTDPDSVADTLDGILLPPATAYLGPAVDVLAERALVVPVTGLDDLAGAVRERTKRIGDRSRGRFVGHLTVARLTPQAHVARVLGARVCAQFDVAEIVLVESRLDARGARYEMLERWPVSLANAEDSPITSP